MKQEFAIYIGFAGTLIGAAVSLSAQYLSSVLTTKREQKRIKERRLAYLISQYYRIYIGEIILSTYMIRFAALTFELDKTVDNSDLYKTGNESLDRAHEIDEKIRLANANYFKTITHFTNLT